MRRFHEAIGTFSPRYAVLLTVLSGLSAGACAQSGGFSGIQPVSVFDPLFGPSAEFPLGQYWIHTTKVDYAWALLGFDYLNPPPVDFDNPASTIAIIDTGIDLDHIEFGGAIGEPDSKIHPDSTSFLQDGSTGYPNTFCDCVESLFGSQPPEDTNPLFPGLGPSHGTIIAGIAGAFVNGTGMAGVSWDCGLLVLRVHAVSADTSSCGASSGTLCRVTEQNVSDAIRYAAGWNGIDFNPQPRARVISISFNSISGIDCDGDNIVADAIEDAYNQGCIIVVAAGNGDISVECWMDDANRCNPDTSWVEPEISTGIAIHPKTIAVGGACVDGTNWHCRSMVNPHISTFSACCPAPDGTDWCDLYYPQPWLESMEVDRLPVLSVVAPMAHTFSTWGDGVVGESNDDFAFTGDGTSFAAPQVAGIIALMLKADPGLTFEEVKHILEVTATDIETAGYDRWTGHGVVDARKAVEYVMKQGLPADWNGDGEIGPIDPVLYVADYAAGDPMTDLDLDTTQTTDDMTIFIDSYTGGGN